MHVLVDMGCQRSQKRSAVRGDLLKSGGAPRVCDSMKSCGSPTRLDRPRHRTNCDHGPRWREAGLAECPTNLRKPRQIDLSILWTPYLIEKPAETTVSL